MFNEFDQELENMLLENDIENIENTVEDEEEIE